MARSLSLNELLTAIDISSWRTTLPALIYHTLPRPTLPCHALFSDIQPCLSPPALPCPATPPCLALTRPVTPNGLAVEVTIFLRPNKIVGGHLYTE